MEGLTKTPTTTIVLPVSAQELVQSLEYVHSTARAAAVSAQVHDDVRRILTFVVNGIQQEVAPEPATLEQVAPVSTSPKKGIKPALSSKKKESDKAKASGPVKEIALGDKETVAATVKK